VGDTCPGPAHKPLATKAASVTGRDTPYETERLASSRPDVLCAAAVRLAVWISWSVSSDAEEMVPTGGELTLFAAVGRWA